MLLNIYKYFYVYIYQIKIFVFVNFLFYLNKREDGCLSIDKSVLFISR